MLEFLEQFKPVAYQDQHGIWTCGYGHTGPDVVRGTTCTRAQAAAWLAGDVGHAEDAVTYLARVPLTQRQFDALVLFAYNVGVAALAGSSLLRYLNGGSPDQAVIEFERWDRIAGVENEGLERRRALEQAVFLDNGV